MNKNNHQDEGKLSESHRSGDTDDSIDEFTSAPLKFVDLLNSRGSANLLNPHIMSQLQVTLESSYEEPGSKLKRSHSPQMNNFHNNFLKFGLWPELSFAKQ